MFCIAAFIVLGIVSIFSASKRKLAKKAWGCTLRRVTFRPCDTSFKEEAKSRLLARVANKTPRLVKLADIGIEIASFLLVFLTIWSLLIAVKSGLDLYVWGTCRPDSANSCSLGAESCSIDTKRSSFWTLTKEGKPYQWFVDEAKALTNTIGNIPTRLKHWDANEYLPANAAYYRQFDSNKPTALEIVDPGCSVCAQVFRNIKQAGFEQNYNLTYIVYPIKDVNNPGSYKFVNSYIVASFLESIKLHLLNEAAPPPDWRIIERIYTEKDEQGIDYQIKVNNLLNADQTRELLKQWLAEFGYDQDEIAAIETDADSDKVKQIINDNSYIVEKRIKTVKIPSIIFNGRRHDGLVKVDSLR